jgi:hypothetical protein
MKAWKKNGKGPAFTGSYERDRKGERVFILASDSGKRITFESYQAAKKLGWVKQ